MTAASTGFTRSRREAFAPSASTTASCTTISAGPPVPPRLGGICQDLHTRTLRRAAWEAYIAEHDPPGWE
ncbi:hypothetical protein MLM_2847 [Mycobacterium lepraemurium]|nr:hypothetical protein MLM_2847 [Mycobacterium lepraemurium]